MRIFRLVPHIALGTIVVIIAAMLGACTSASAPESTIQQSSEPPVAQVSSKQPTSDVAAADVERAKKSHEKTIASFNAAFTENSNWEAAVMGTDGGPVCQLRDRFNDISRAMAHIEGTFLPQLKWEDVSISKEDAKRKLKEAATQYATELNRLLDLSFQEREKMGTCGAGEGSMELVDAGYLTRDIVEALKSFGGSPADIKTTPEKLRGRLLADYLARIDRERKEKAKNSDASGPDHLIRAAVLDWQFTQEQLGISKEEFEASYGR